ncbi:MAG: aminoacyl-tRNA hydrolase [Wolbachia endosymbiont of Fragariocoptes setiger]|nr:aminoacyl-tRNA hydrolase [Wolbachia endosymbiont of Fragariocoptes setiger]
MYLIVGLGNPGKSYESTYHNIGFIIVDRIHKCWNFQPFVKKTDYLIAPGTVNEGRVMLLKPMLFMNNSGTPVLNAIRFYKLALSNVIVIHDDADLQMGKIKIKKGGRSAGHNGIKSIDNSIGTAYWRLRVGIGRPVNSCGNLADYVLSKFQDSNTINNVVEEIARNIDLTIESCVKDE